MNYELINQSIVIRIIKTAIGTTTRMSVIQIPKTSLGPNLVSSVTVENQGPNVGAATETITFSPCFIWYNRKSKSVFFSDVY